MKTIELKRQLSDEEGGASQGTAKKARGGIKSTSTPTTTITNPSTIAKSDRKTTSTSTAHTASTATTSKKTSKNDIEMIDVAKQVGLLDGVRIEVRWDLTFHEDDEDGKETEAEAEHQAGNEKENQIAQTNEEEKGLAGVEQEHETETRWWGGVLQAADGRVYTIRNANDNDEVTVPIRTIDYDPYLPNFPNRSLEDVCFLTDHSLLNMSSQTRTCWRIEGHSWEPPTSESTSTSSQHEHGHNSPTTTTEQLHQMDDDEISVTSTSQEDGLREVLDTILQSALQSSGVLQKMKSIHPSQQCVMAEKIANMKDKLLLKLLDKLKLDVDVGSDRVVTPELIKIVMTELGNELSS
jgi:hypothetical protein